MKLGVITTPWALASGLSRPEIFRHIAAMGFHCLVSWASCPVPLGLVTNTDRSLRESAGYVQEIAPFLTTS